MSARRETRFILVAALVAVTWAGVSILQDRRFPRPVSEGETEAAAGTLLVEKLSGPGYFRMTAGESTGEGGPWIQLADAWSQVPRIAAERHLDPAGTRVVERLIDSMAEPHPHRMVGGKRIHLPRLNLSLDAIKNKDAPERRSEGQHPLNERRSPP